VREQLVAHQPAVDVPQLQVRRGAREGGQRRPAGQAQRADREIEPQCGIHEGGPEQAPQAVFAGRQIERRRQLLDDPAVVRPAERHRKARQRQTPQQLVDVLELGLLAAQKLAPRRQVVEQIAHRDGGAGAVCGRGGFDLAGRELRRGRAGHRRGDVQARH
jgi:hypothetical protein